MPSVTPFFQTSLEFKLTFAGGDTTVRVFQSSLNDTFRIATSRIVDSIVVDPNGWLLCKVGSVTYDPTVSVDGQQTPLPVEFALEQNYPNPFNPVTTISYQLPVTSPVRLVVHDMLGREVAVLVREKKEPGNHEVRFDGSGLSSGVYFYRMKAGDFVQTRRLLLLK